MSIPIQNTNPQIDTWSGFVDRSNQAFHVISNYAITTALTAGGGLTVGNAYVQGLLGADGLVTNTLRGGSLVAPGALTITSNLVANGSTSTFNSNTVFAGTNARFTANTEMAATLVVNGGSTFNSTLAVSGLFTANTGSLANVSIGVISGSLVTVTANTNLKGSLIADNPAAFNNTVTIVGTTTANAINAVSANVATFNFGTGNVAGNTTFGQNVMVIGDLQVTGNLSFNQTSYADIIPSGPGYALGNTANRWALNATTGNFNGVVSLGTTIIFNSDATGAPTANASIVVRRGTSANTVLGWDEVTDKWVIDTQAIVLDNATTYNISISGQAATALVANNATNLNGQNSAYYLNAGNLTGTVASARLSGTYGINVTGSANTANTAAFANNATYLNGQLPAFYLNYNNLANVPATFAPAAHTHPISQVVNLQATLDGKFSTSGGDVLGNIWVDATTVERNIGFKMPGGGQVYWYATPASRTVGLWDSGTNRNPFIYNANTGTVNINGTAVYINGGAIITDNNFDPSNLNANNITTGTLAPARLSGTYAITANNATNLNGQNSAYYLNAGNLTGTVASARLSGTYGINVTGDAGSLGGQAPAYYLNAGNLTGTVASARLSGTYGINVTGSAGSASSANYATSAGTAGNADNATNLSGQAPAYYLNAGNLTGTVADARLPGTMSGKSFSSGISVTGAVTATGNITGYSSSDKALKKDAVRLTNALDIVNGLTGYKYKWNIRGLEVTGRHGSDMGIYAQDLEKVMPDFVGTDEHGYKYIKNGYNVLIPVLIEAIKELSAKLESRS